jgi:ATP-dependent Clp protease ATP-binding subunit ClpA
MMHLLLQILEEEQITIRQDIKIDSPLIIIMTSNVGADLIRRRRRSLTHQKPNDNYDDTGIRFSKRQEGHGL